MIFKSQTPTQEAEAYAQKHGYKLYTLKKSFFADPEKMFGFGKDPDGGDDIFLHAARFKIPEYSETNTPRWRWPGRTDLWNKFESPKEAQEEFASEDGIQEGDEIYAIPFPSDSGLKCVDWMVKEDLENFFLDVREAGVLWKIASAILNISHEDLSTAEKQIFEILKDQGYLELDEHGEVTEII